VGRRNPADADIATAAELRSLPAVHELAAALDAPHPLAVAAARRAIDERRREIRARGPEARRDDNDDSADDDLTARARELLGELELPSLRRVINATGVIVHTNLGRAPLATAARDAVTDAAQGYSNLELDLDSGARGSRHDHVEGLLTELTGADAAIAINNGAAAVLLATAALAGPGRAIVVSRGQLVEIGGGFRIPDVIAQSGAQLIEVGTTNRTRIEDYERAIADAAGSPAHAPVGAILRVHPSNFRAVGFVEDVPIESLCALGPPVIDDVGSGVLGSGASGVLGSGASGVAAITDEPPIARSVAAGAAVVCCSGDKLLGGPQAGLLIGRGDAVAAARRHPLARALRIDKLSLAALEATLRLYRDPACARHEIPVLAMLQASEETLGARAQALAAQIGSSAQLTRAIARVGGGALPLLELEGPVVALSADRDPVALARALRAGDPPVIARIHDGRVILDPRTLADGEIAPAAATVRGAL
jgi:L-seryl-tRNA(Ser) seleniumtransferase